MTFEKKVLVLDPANFIGGAEIFMLDFFNSISETTHIKFYVGTTGNQQYISRVPSFITLKIFPLPRLRFLFNALYGIHHSLRDIRQFIYQEKIDVIVTNSARAHIIASLVVRKTNTKLVWIMHDMTFSPWLFRFFGKYPKAIICVSEMVKKYVKQWIPQKEHSKLTVVYNGISLKNVEKRSQQELSVTKEENEVWIGTIGRIEPWKGQKYFILAAKEVLKSIPNAKFFLIGSSVPQRKSSVLYERKIRALVEKLELSDRVHFMGYQENVYSLLKRFDIFVHTSIDPEPFGRVILDAMALKKAVIASPYGGPAEIVKQNETGYLIDPKDTIALSEKIIELCQDTSKRITIGNAGYEHIKTTFSQTKISEHILSLLQTLS